MKTFRTLGTMLLAATLSLGAISCEDAENAPIVLDPTIKPTVVDEVLAKMSDKLDAHHGEVTPFIAFPDKGAPIRKIVIAEGGKAFLYSAPSEAITRSIISDVITCEYKIVDGNIVINAGKEYGDITITSIGNAVKIAIESVIYAAEKEETPAPTTESAVNICRAWSKAKYSAGIYFDKLPIYGAIDKEKVEVDDIRILKKSIMDKLVTDTKLKDEGFKFLENNIVGINFLTNGKVYVTYSNDTVEESEWNWIDEAKGKLHTTIDGKEVDIDVRCEAGTPNTAYFIIDANLNGVGGIGKHTLSGRFVCKMTDK